MKWQHTHTNVAKLSIVDVLTIITERICEALDKNGEASTVGVSISKDLNSV